MEKGTLSAVTFVDRAHFYTVTGTIVESMKIITLTKTINFEVALIL